MPDDQLPLSAGLNDFWRTVTSVRCGRQRPPQFLARVFVERNHNRALPADHAEYLVPIDERVTAKAPHRRSDAVLLLHVLRPQGLAALCVEANQIPFRAERINFSAA